MNLLHLVEKAKGFSSNLKLLLDQERSMSSQEPMMPNVLPKDQLRLKLSALQFKVTQEKFTEKPFSGKYLSESRAGLYVCVVCDSKLFDSASKFSSNSGWPSFSNVIERRAVALRPDTSSGELRVEVACKNCGAHLGHLFDDGPKPSGLRYCINSSALLHERDQCVRLGTDS
ncbi:peptide-methionine (R)-S-oxide reductase [Paragonimus westermani]|uniref:Peptide-methionine (R)-S-oxide reductase n=1 Tax=Paragonimus westermani TaxID=34504 RepID=A0A5J4NR67_9TREM|nr:peptide-methionine (R)-S-oxide reductase [Paragonimus westermani]